MKVLFAVLNMGLGHATRSLGLMHALLKQKIAITVVSTGRSLILLKQELQDSNFPVNFIDCPDYNLKYSKRSPLMFKVMLQIPGLLKGIKKEQQFLLNLLQKEKYDFIISDHRYGFYHKDTPSFFITHQLMLMPPLQIPCLKRISVALHIQLLKRFKAVIIPDFEIQPNLSGELSHHRSSGKMNRFYAGPWSSIVVKNEPVENAFDILAIISGPEPQRTVLEEKLLALLAGYPGNVAVILGKPGESEHYRLSGTLNVYCHVERTEMFKLIQQSRLVICRSGYSTVMELAALKKPAIFIPTPGQSEQEYLADYYAQKKWYPCLKQREIDKLPAVLKNLIKHYSGFPGKIDAPENYRKTVDFILETIQGKTGSPGTG